MLSRVTREPWCWVIRAALAMVVRQPALASGGMIEDAAAALCLFCIPFHAIIPFTLMIWSMRRGASTDLRRNGAVAGLVAGAIGATVHSFSCQGDSWVFVFLGTAARPRYARSSEHDLDLECCAGS
jgi:hypothetical protein